MSAIFTYPVTLMAVVGAMILAAIGCMIAGSTSDSQKPFATLGQAMLLTALTRVLGFVPSGPEWTSIRNILLMVMMLITTGSVSLLCVAGLQFRKARVSKTAVVSVLVALGVIAEAYLAFQVGGGEKLEIWILNLSLAFGYFVLAIGMFYTRAFKKQGGYSMMGSVCLAMIVVYVLKNIDYFSTEISTWEAVLYALVGMAAIYISLGAKMQENALMIKEIQDHKDRLRLVIQSSPFPIVLARLRDNKVLITSKKATEILGVNPKSDMKISDFFADENNRKELLSLLEKHTVAENFEVRMKRPNDNETFWMLVSARVIDFEYEIALYMAFQDITNRKQKEMKLYDQATRDPLTGCYNRRSFEELAAKEVSKMRRTKTQFALAMLDADHFKKVNDTYGHAVGDIVLQQLASSCRKVFRETDLIARFGGEEFVILLPETPLDMAYKVVERLRTTVEALDIEGDKKQIVKVTISQGLVESRADADIATLLKEADAALYVAKQQGRNRVIIAQPGMDSKPVEAASGAMAAPPKPAVPGAPTPAKATPTPGAPVGKPAAPVPAGVAPAPKPLGAPMPARAPAPVPRQAPARPQVIRPVYNDNEPPLPDEAPKRRK
ncbi:hypothetical protein FACS1894186_7370 [Alphaproteobacteria bacterium]|nr:hypothetical protein FACS1894186_7370 [Alphaproteobacteria bacterium]